MAFEFANDGEVPTHTTVAEYTVSRLGQVPTVRIKYADTVDDGVNVFGFAAQRSAGTGRTWELTFQANTPEKTLAMGQMITGVMLNIGRALLTALNITAETVTDAQLLAAVLAIDNVDSFIATAFEQLEKDRRVGQGPELWVLGPAPAPHPAP